MLGKGGMIGGGKERVGRRMGDRKWDTIEECRQLVVG